MKPVVSRWLRTYSLEARPRHLSRDLDAAERSAKFDEAREVVSGRLRKLTYAENHLLSLMTRDDSTDTSELAELAFLMMAGKPLAEFACDLVAWRFGTAVNSSFDDPHTLFLQLVRLNSVDWAETRQALLKVCAPLRADPSYCGSWALHGVLSATGNPDDASDAETIYKELVQERSPRDGFGRFSGICSLDPCDPASDGADVRETAKRYSVINVAGLRQQLSMTGPDHDLERARCAIARFDPTVGIEKHRELLEHVLGRSGFPLRQGLFEMHRHNMLIEREDALRLIGRVHEGTAGVQDPELDESDRHLTSQYHLLLAFPQLDFEEQLNAMLTPGSTTNFLLSLLPLIKRPSEDLLASRFRQALDQSDELALVLLMAFCRYLEWGVPAVINEALPNLAGQGSPRVREQAISLIAASEEPALWRFFSDTNWRADGVPDLESRERWDGSWILIKAARNGILPIGEVFDRIDAYLYGIAAHELGSEAAIRFGAYLDAAIRHSAGFTVDDSHLLIEMPHTGRNELELPRIRAELIEPEPTDTAEAMRRIVASDDEIRNRSRKARIAFRTFKKLAREQNLDVLLHDVRPDALEAVVRAAPALADSWVNAFQEMPVSKRSTLHHIGVMLASAVASSEPQKATALLAVLEGTPPAIWHTYGKEKLTLSAVVVWGADDHEGFHELRFQRLDEAANDAEIAMEVIAALSYGRRDVLDKYLKEKLRSGSPADIARAVTVCGLSTMNETCASILGEFEKKSGFIGTAARAAVEAYKRHIWACHWFDAMHTSVSPSELWRYCQLFRKVADARFEIVLGSTEKGTELFELYRPSIMEGIHNRYEKRQGKRQKTLFGAEAPDRSFFERIRHLSNV